MKLLLLTILLALFGLSHNSLLDASPGKQPQSNSTHIEELPYGQTDEDLNSDLHKEHRREVYESTEDKEVYESTEDKKQSIVDYVNQGDIDGNTPLHYASLKGHKEIAAVLLEAGAKIDAENIYGETPAHFAAMGGQLDCLQFLIDNGANLSAVNNHNQTLLHYAVIAMSGKDPLLEFEKRRVPLDFAS